MARILVPLDGSQLAEEALPWAAALARSRGDSLHLLSVYSWDEQFWEAARIDPLVVTEGARAQFESYLAGLARRPEFAGLTVTSDVRPGDPAQEVARAVGESPTAMVVLTTHGRGGFDGTGRGSVADKLVRTLTVPVVVVPPHVAVAPIQSVAVPLDGSFESETALPFARTVAGQAGANVHLLSAVDPELTWHFPEPGGTTAQEHLRERAESYLEGRRATGETVDVPTGKPASVIVEHARNRNCQLIVMGTHGRSGAVRLDLGSVADDVVRKAACPVVLVPIGRKPA